MTTGVREMRFLLAGPEGRILRALAARVPRSIRSNHLTAIGTIGAAAAGIAYALTTYHPAWLWVASLMLAVNWLGDSLDGTLARVRGTQRPKYGYYLDHVVDAFSTAVIGLGIGLSPYVNLGLALGLVVVYLALSINVYLESSVFGVFKIAYGRIGPTEVRLLLVVATPLTAQTVRGQLTDSLTRSPLPGAFLTLVDEQGVERARSITNAAGEFLITAPAAGTYRLRSKRIGFRPYVSTALVLGAGETSALNAAVAPIAVVLSEVVVVGERQCNVASGGQGGASVGAVWEEIREALAAVAWTSRLPSYWYDIAHFQRELTATARRQAGRPDSVWRNIGYQAVSFQSAPPEELEARGFVVPDAEGGWTYWGPDAEALMSSPFLRSHCFE